VTEGILYRLLPQPALNPLTWVERLHASLHRGGGLMFFVAYALALACLVDLSWKTLRDRRWPAGLNGFLAVCFLLLALLGISALTGSGGPRFAAGFTVLSLAVVLTLAMHAFAHARGASPRALLVAFTGAAVCSAFSVGAEALARGASVSSAWLRASDAALPAGEALLAAAAAFAFLAWHDASGPGAWAGIVPAGLGAIALAAGSVLPSPRWALVEGLSPMRLALLACALFLATLTGLSCLVDPRRRAMGAGILVLLLAGFPLRIAHQQMLAVIGMALLVAPPPRLPREAAALPARPSAERENVLVLYARAPVLGRVKTRLQPELSAWQALRLHEAMLADTLERLRAACDGVATLCISWSGEPPLAGEISDLARGLRWEMQRAGNLGDRMGDTFSACAAAGFLKTVLIGSDSPHLPRPRVREAFEALAAADVVLGPTVDGGYYLIGARRAPGALLRDMPWGTPDVLPMTRHRLAEAGHTHQELAADFDLDTPDDARRLLALLRGRRDQGDKDVPSRTLAVLESLFPQGPAA
jgi:hypothetical protein